MRLRMGMAIAFTLLAAMALLLTAGSVSAQTLAGTKHDLTATGGAQAGFKLLGATDYMCKPCHAPHKATAVTDMPLLNHAPTVAAITGYTFQAGGTTAPSTVDLVCLSCHDGTVAVDAWSGNTGTIKMTPVGTPGAGLLETAAYVGTNLSGTHPTSTAMPTGAGWNVPTASKLFGVTNDVKCASCHNPHGNIATGSFFLRALPAAICQDCHAK